MKKKKKKDPLQGSKKKKNFRIKGERERERIMLGLSLPSSNFLQFDAIKSKELNQIKKYK